jgi:nicotinate-nucleotide adenylyltransferase
MARQPRRLCFGGSFNPIHHGHLLCARAVAETAGFDKVILIPSANPPHKPDANDLAGPADRIHMCRLATKGQPDFEVDDLELSIPAPSYTIETARTLKKRGWDQVFWLIGADMLHYLPQWHQPLVLMEEVTFIVMARPGWSLDWDLIPPEYRKLRENVVEAPLIDVSATQIRERVRTGKSIAYLTPELVAEYIAQRKLFR